MPLSFAGFRFVSTSTLRPCICSTGTNFTRPETICSVNPAVKVRPSKTEMKLHKASDDEQSTQRVALL